MGNFRTHFEALLETVDGFAMLDMHQVEDLWRFDALQPLVKGQGYDEPLCERLRLALGADDDEAERVAVALMGVLGARRSHAAVAPLTRAHEQHSAYFVRSLAGAVLVKIGEQKSLLALADPLVNGRLDLQSQTHRNAISVAGAALVAGQPTLAFEVLGQTLRRDLSDWPSVDGHATEGMLRELADRNSRGPLPGPDRGAWRELFRQALTDNTAGLKEPDGLLLGLLQTLLEENRH